ncbi:hypothetical protein OPV22_012227 [Ensete ventricosum]|uniref:Uncharacterized protein n=1 Tax=Ensete ventricosum TaxID=4639 RepID=A0AAV8R131_ENSVE|nr:hypothetical protein OPV22_012227 [Ensete ventricosum]
MLARLRLHHPLHECSSTARDTGTGRANRRLAHLSVSSRENKRRREKRWRMNLYSSSASRSSVPGRFLPLLYYFEGKRKKKCDDGNERLKRSLKDSEMCECFDIRGVLHGVPGLLSLV